MDEVTLSEVLAAREKRVLHQKCLLEKYGFPGFKARNNLTFNAGFRKLFKHDTVIDVRYMTERLFADKPHANPEQRGDLSKNSNIK